MNFQMAKELTLSVVGMGYRLSVDKRNELDELAPFKVKLEREPKNLHDENAIQVVMDDKTMKNNGMQIGYLPRLVAGAWAPALDSGKLKILESWMTAVPESGDGEVFVKFQTSSKALSKSLQIAP